MPNGSAGMTAGLYGGVDMAKVMYGQNASHVPAWMYVQDQGPGIAGFVGASRTTGQTNPLTYGAGHWTGPYPGHTEGGIGTYYSHHFIVGEIIVRPHLVIGTNALQGMGMGGLYLGDHDFQAMLSDGAVVAGSAATLARVRQQWEG